MKKDDTMVNLDVKGNLAKLIATENIIIQHNKVSTASFDVKNRVLTLPIFKEQKGDVYDMLIAHECAHALFTPYKEWEAIATNDELRAYVNVLEDTRIDKLIQAKYPGVIINYKNGFDILDKKNFFGLIGKDINKDLMLIDKINIRSKSLNRLPFIFTPEENKWLAKVDSIVTFDDVVALAKEMIEWQKEQVKEMKKLPNFDDLSISKIYELSDDEDDLDEDVGQGANSDAEKSDDDADEKNDFNNFGDQKADDEKDGSGSPESSDEESNKPEDGKEASHYGPGAGGDFESDKLLKAVTQQSFDNKVTELLNQDSKGYTYGNMPEPNYKDALTSYQQFLNTFAKEKTQSYYNYKDIKAYDNWLQDKYKKFLKENKKTVSYLVKEFEMKKAATAYKRASTDKTGIIDPLKLKDYKFSDDIFKRLTIIPDGKNHGMMMLLDWSGSMSDVLNQTVHQLINLVEFVRRVNIPFEVYFFTSERKYFSDATGYDKSFIYKNGDWKFEDFNLVNVASHKMSKKQLDLAMMYMFHMGEYYNDNYGRGYRDYDRSKPNGYGIPREFHLGNTPLNEALIFLNKLIPLFKKKYGIEKMNLITLTDGGANGMRGRIHGSEKDYDWGTNKVYNMSKNKRLVKKDSDEDLTGLLLKYIKETHDTNVIGFYLLKRVRRWDIERYADGKDYYEREKNYSKLRKQMTKEKAIDVDKFGYDKYFLINGKTMKVENFSMAEAEVKKGTTGELKRIFAGSMKQRITSRVVLNKFIQEVA